MDWTAIVTATVAAVSGAGVGVFGARSKKSEAAMTVAVGKDEIVLVHYDKIVDQLQEEVKNLRGENTTLRASNLQLEKDMLDLNRQVFALTSEITNLKKWMADNLEKTR